MKQTEHPYWHRLYRCLEDFGTRYQNIPDFFKDRIQRYGILSLFILLFGSFMGTWMKDKTFIFWSFLLGIIGFIRTYLIFRTADKKTYESWKAGNRDRREKSLCKITEDPGK